MNLREVNCCVPTERIRNLETAVRRWRNIVIVLLLLFGTAMVLGATAYDAAPLFDSVRARELNILDASGKVRALIRVGQDDSVALALLDTAGRTRASLALAPNGAPRLRLYDELEKSRAGLEIESDGAGATVLATADGTLYLGGVSETVRELPSMQGLRLRKEITVSGIRAAPEGTHRMVDAERLPAQ